MLDLHYSYTAGKMKQKKYTPRALTQKQENFCLKYFECSNQTESYRFAYNAENMKPATCNRNAKAVFDNNKVATRIKQLQNESKKETLITAKMKKDLLWLMANEAHTAEDYNASKGCVAELNKMDGDHAPVKNDNKNETTGNLSIEVRFVK